VATKVVYLVTDSEGVTNTYDDLQEFYSAAGYNSGEYSLKATARPNLWNYYHNDEPEIVIYTVQQGSVQVPNPLPDPFKPEE
jgi:hypothetical protein